ncbi:MAG: UbiA family prenyltransferase [Streptosporangiales bacterium]|nr:UbiA family prenyltransferase [Streptosporangiales bacterium]MBO0890139.1 UbiA family prenyltransferase [Acidothermales bacterium]
MTTARAVVELVRAPAALSVPGDSLAGAAAAGWPFGAATPALGVASACLYWAGMALNDYADRDVDAVERPQRPIPSGRVSPRFALGVASGLTAAGVGVAGLVGGRRGTAVAVPLAATVWAYDLALKSTPAGPVAMGAARALDVLLGAGAGRLRPALPAALTLGAHTVAITTLSRHEVTGGSRLLPAVTLAATAAVTAAALRGTGRSPVDRVANAALLAGYAGTFGRTQVDAVRQPNPTQLQRAVGAGILAMMPLQAALAAGAGALCAAVPVAAAFPVARRLARKVSPT